MWFTDCSCICVSIEYVVVTLTTLMTYMCVYRVCSRYINYLDDVFWSTEFKVHSIDGKGNGWQTVYFTTVKCVLGRGGGKGRREG